MSDRGVEALRPPSRVYTGLAEPALIYGVEPKLLLVNVGLGVFFFVLFKFYALFWVPLGWVLHYVLKVMTKHDPHMRLIYVRYAVQADRYEAWPDPSPRLGHRPLHWGRGVV